MKLLEYSVKQALLSKIMESGAPDEDKSTAAQYVKEMTYELLLSEDGEPYTEIGWGWILERIEPIFRL